MDDARWEEDEEEEDDNMDEDDDSEDDNPLPSASKYPPSKAQREEDEKFKHWLAQTKQSST